MSVFATEAGHWCERLYDKKAAQLVLYGRALGLTHGEAEDVVQDTFIALLKLPAPPQEPEFYCIAAFRNRALNYRRGLFRRLAREFESTHWFERTEEDQETEQQDAAVRAMQNLPREQREAIVLKFWHDYTFEKIGQVMGTSPNTAAGRYRYGMEKLRAILERNEYERNRASGRAFALVETPAA